MDSCHRSLRRPTVADPPRDRSRSAGHENRRSLSAVRFYRLPIANRELRYAADGGARRTLDRRWNRNEVASAAVVPKTRPLWQLRAMRDRLAARQIGRAQGRERGSESV